MVKETPGGSGSCQLVTQDCFQIKDRTESQYHHGIGLSPVLLFLIQIFWECSGIWKQLIEYFLPDPFVLQPCQHIFDILLRDQPIHDCRLAQTVPYCCCFRSCFRIRKQEPLPAYNERLYHPFSQVVVDRIVPILQITGQRVFPFQKVICSLCCFRSIIKTPGDPLHSCDHLVKQWLRLLLPQFIYFFRVIFLLPAFFSTL